MVLEEEQKMAKKLFGKDFYDLSSSQMGEIRLKFQDKRPRNKIFKERIIKV